MKMTMDTVRYTADGAMDMAASFARRMLATDAMDNAFEDWAVFGSYIHRFVIEAASYGAQVTAITSDLLRKELSNKLAAEDIPADDFIYFAGSCFSIGHLADEIADPESVAKNLASVTASNIGTMAEGELPAFYCEDTIIWAAMHTDKMLNAYTKELIRLVNEKNGENSLSYAGSPFTILPDGGTLLLHYIYSGITNPCGPAFIAS